MNKAISLLTRSFAALASLLLCAAGLLPAAISARAEGGVSSGSCGDGLTWVLSADGRLTISGTGEMTDYGCDGMEADPVPRAPWADTLTSYDINIRSVSLDEGCTSIGNFAFYELYALTEVSLPSTLTSIGMYAFDGDGSLLSLRIPDATAAIGESAFSGCARLTVMVLPASLDTVNDNLFCGCKSLIYVSIPASVFTIYSDVFTGCDKLKTLMLPEGIYGIEYNSLSGSSIETLVLPENYCNISCSALSNAQCLRKVYIPLTQISLPEQIFTDTGITDVCYQGSEEDWAKLTADNDIEGLDAINVSFNCSSPVWTRPLEEVRADIAALDQRAAEYEREKQHKKTVKLLIFSAVNLLLLGVLIVSLVSNHRRRGAIVNNEDCLGAPPWLTPGQ